MNGLLNNINCDGVLIGLATFLIIGLFHPLVIKGEYYFGVRIKYAFLLCGIAALVGSLLTDGALLSILLGVTAFSCFWSIHEVTEQVCRVEKGWFPANPRRKYRKVN